MQRLEVSGAVRLIYRSLGVKGLNKCFDTYWRIFQKKKIENDVEGRRSLPNFNNDWHFFGFYMSFI